MNKELDAFRNSDWKGEILPKLTTFTASLVHKYNWSTQGSLPKGLQVEDLVIDAIKKTMEGLNGTRAATGVRYWDMRKCPELLEYLKGVVRSDISALAKSHDHQRTYRQINEELTSDDLNTPDGRYEELKGLLQAQIAGNPEAQQYLLATEELIHSGEDASSEAVMQLTGFTYPQLRNAKRKLQTAIHKMEVIKEKGSHK